MNLVGVRTKRGRPPFWVEDVLLPENQEGTKLFPLVFLLLGFTIKKKLARQEGRDG